MGRIYSAGDWTVKPGHDEEAFMEAWHATMDVNPPTPRPRARLLRDLKRPGHFLSIVEWEDQEAITEFRSRPGFSSAMDAVRDHADVELFTLEQVAEG